MAGEQAVYIVFRNMDGSGEVMHGPYSLAQIVEDTLFACHYTADPSDDDNGCHALALLVDGRWHVNDGLGTDGPTYETVLFRGPAAEGGD
jgi:hypothetical protein